MKPDPERIILWLLAVILVIVVAALVLSIFDVRID